MPNHEITRDFNVGIDVGDRYSYLCLLDTKTGDVVEELRTSTNPAAFERRLSSPEPTLIAMEAGTHSHWIGRILEDCVHEIIIAKARKLKLIYGEGIELEEAQHQHGAISFVLPSRF